MPTAYAYAAQYRDEIRALCVLEAGLPGINEDEKRHLWHTRFHGVRDLPERLVAGRERLYLDWFYKEGAYDPSAIDDEARDEYVRCYSQAGGLRGGFEYYRAYETDAEHNRTHAEDPLEVPVLALGGAASFQDLPIRDMEAVATDVEGRGCRPGRSLDSRGTTGVLRRSADGVSQRRRVTAPRAGGDLAFSTVL